MKLHLQCQDKIFRIHANAERRVVNLNFGHLYKGRA